MNILEGINKIITKLGSDKKVDNITDGLNQISENISGSENGTSSKGVFCIDLNYSSSGTTCNQKWSDIVKAYQNGMVLIVRVSMLHIDDGQMTGKYEMYFYHIEVDSDQNGAPNTINVSSSHFLPQGDSSFQYNQMAFYIIEGDNDNTVASLDDTLTFQTVFQGLSS